MLVISSLRRRFGCMLIPTCLIYVYVVISFVCVCVLHVSLHLGKVLDLADIF